MATNVALSKPSGESAPKEGAKGLLLTLVLLTVLAAVVGGGFGLTIVSGIEKRLEDKYKDLPQRAANPSPYVGDIAIKKVAPVVTNLANSESDWIRLEGSIVYKPHQDTNPDLLVSETRQDVLAYLRTVSISQIQGPSGLLHAREDLNERVKVRSKGVIQEFVIETLVIQ